MGPVAEKQYRNSISLVQSQLKASILPFLQVVIGIPPSQFTNDLDLLKAETLRTILKILSQVASVDPVLLFFHGEMLDSDLLTQALQYCFQLVYADYPVDENAQLGQGPPSE